MSLRREDGAHRAVAAGVQRDAILMVISSAGAAPSVLPRAFDDSMIWPLAMNGCLRLSECTRLSACDKTPGVAPRARLWFVLHDVRKGVVADIFISYSKVDRVRADAIRELLRGEGYSVAIDHDFLVAGDAYRDAIAEQIRTAKAVLVLWSESAVESAFVRDEANRASRQTVLLQLIIDALPQADVPLGFGELQSLRCEWASEDDLADGTRTALLAALKRQLPAVEPLGAAVQLLKQEVERKLASEYEIFERIGTGRMSVVFKALHRVHGTVALKVTPLAGILLLPGFYAEVRASMEAARELSHPNVLAIRDVKLLDSIACTVMDFIEGSTLAAIMTAKGRLPLGLIKDIACDIAQALAHAHQNGIVHSRLSPANVMIERGVDRALVSDFGMPNMGRGPEAAAARALYLDARYMSPEQCLGVTPTPQSDQYALGAILYELLTGKPPFQGVAVYSVMKGHCEHAPSDIAERRPECPPEVIRSVLRMLAKDPKERFLTTSMLAHVIAEWPVAESLPSATLTAAGHAPKAAKIALESYNRCLADLDFLALFYQRLQADSVLARHFQNVNFDRQVEALRRGIRYFLEFAQQPTIAAAEVERIAVGHRRFALDPGELERFIEVLVELAVERDPDTDRVGGSAFLRQEWRAALEPSMARFLELTRSRRESGVALAAHAGAVGASATGAEALAASGAESGG
jgi:hypothetical protein